MMGFRLLLISLVTLSLSLGSPLSASAWTGSDFPLLAKNDKGPGEDAPIKVIDTEGKGSKGKSKGPRGGKGKGLDKAAMNQVRNAYKFLEQGKPEKALAELEKAHRMAPNNYWVNYYSAGAYHELKEYSKARRYWVAAEGSAETPEERSRVRTAQAYTDYLGGATEQARAGLKVAAEIDPTNGRARQLLAELTTPAAPGQPQAGARLQLGEVNSFLGYFMVPMK